MSFIKIIETAGQKCGEGWQKTSHAATMMAEAFSSSSAAFPESPLPSPVFPAWAR
jgi:hypothetical protein